MRVQVALAIVINASQQILITQRKEGQHLAGCWEFPGGKVEPGESPELALARELKEEVGLTLLNADPLPVITHDYPERTVELHPFYVSAEGEAVSCEGQALRWVTVDSLKNYDFPEANNKLIEVVNVI